jgi:hypothetical protein
MCEECHRIEAEVERLRGEQQVSVELSMEVERLETELKEERDAAAFARQEARAEVERLREERDDLQAAVMDYSAALGRIAYGDIPFADGQLRAGSKGRQDFEAFARNVLAEEKVP